MQQLPCRARTSDDSAALRSEHRPAALCLTACQQCLEQRRGVAGALTSCPVKIDSSRATGAGLDKQYRAGRTLACWPSGRCCSAECTQCRCSTAGPCCQRMQDCWAIVRACLYKAFSQTAAGLQTASVCAMVGRARISNNTLNGCSVSAIMWSVYPEYLRCLVWSLCSESSYQWVCPLNLHIQQTLMQIAGLLPRIGGNSEVWQCRMESPCTSSSVYSGMLMAE